MFEASELRKDIITGETVIIAANRRFRPQDFKDASGNTKSLHSSCPFCPGNEKLTPPEILTVPQENDSAAWDIRVVPNKFPMINPTLFNENHRDHANANIQGCCGEHEVVIESPIHNESFANLSVRRITKIFQTFQSRIAAFRKNPALKSFVIFKNEGADAGASLIHPHSQVLATNFIPQRVKREFSLFRKHFSQNRNCLVCGMIKNELKNDARIISRQDDFVALAPFAARKPYETWILPTSHQPIFEKVGLAQLRAFSLLLKSIVVKFRELLNTPAFNFAISSPIIQSKLMNLHHWRLEIAPVTSKQGGFEWNSGIFVNSVPPEIAAKRLKLTLSE